MGQGSLLLTAHFEHVSIGVVPLGSVPLSHWLEGEPNGTPLCWVPYFDTHTHTYGCVLTPYPQDTVSRKSMPQMPEWMKQMAPGVDGEEAGPQDTRPLLLGGMVDG